MELQTPDMRGSHRAPSDPAFPSSWDLPFPRYGHFRSSFDRVHLKNHADLELQTPGVGRYPWAPHTPGIWPPKSAWSLSYARSKMGLLTGCISGTTLTWSSILRAWVGTHGSPMTPKYGVPRQNKGHFVDKGMKNRLSGDTIGSSWTRGRLRLIEAVRGHHRHFVDKKNE